MRILAAFSEPADPQRVAAAMAERLQLGIEEVERSIAELRAAGLLEVPRPPSKATQRAGRVTPSFPARAAHGHVVLVDIHHRTLYGAATDPTDHVGDGAVLGLLQHDGFRIELVDGSFHELPAPERAVLLVHGLRPTREGHALAADEVDALSRWIHRGGAALVVAGHDPNEPALGALSSAFGVDFRGGYAHHPDHANPQGGPCSWFVLQPERGLEVAHPIVATAAAAGLALERIGYYCGGAMHCEAAAALLRLPAGTRLLGHSASDDWIGMCALEHGRGRIAFVLDRGIFRAQEIETERGPLYVTMTQPDLHNANLFVATMRWLARHDAST